MDLKLQLKPLSYPWERIDCANKESDSFFKRRNGSFAGYSNMMESRAKVLAGIVCN